MDMLLPTTFEWQVYYQDLIEVIIVGMKCMHTWVLCRAVFKG